MSNIVTIDRIAYQTLNAAGEIVGSNYGIRCFDDYGCEYINTIERLTSLLEMQPKDLIAMARSLNENASVMIAHAISHNLPISVDDELIPVETIDFDQPAQPPAGPA